VETLYALRTYDEILIAVRAQLHTPLARPTLLTGEEMKVEGTTNCVKRRKAREDPGLTCCA